MVEVKHSCPFLIALIGDRSGGKTPHDRGEAAGEAGIMGDVSGRGVTEIDPAERGSAR